ncbi:MAG TPA: cystathionine gamma-synthase [Thermoanaerobaculia bacterium]|nr:cystathionine gamma-synthase [Thermoanaerobaculia bacterium]
MSRPTTSRATPTAAAHGSAAQGSSAFGPATLAARAGIGADLQHGAVMPPLHLSSNFTFAGLGEKRRYDYTRSGNPTRDLLGEALAAAEGGAGGIVTSSGMAAVHLALQLLEPGDLLVAPFDCYGGTHRLLTSLARRGAFRLELVDLTDFAARDAALARRPRMVWIETPSNPLLRITDVRAVAALAHEHDTLVAVDNTFLSPALQRPLELGADLVVHSTTKYLNGHSDVVGGAVIAAEPELHEQIGWWANCLGITGAPFDSYLTLRGLRTLGARLRAHLENTTEVVDLLVAHPAVSKVHYPGLPDHPGHAVARSQQRGFGAIVSFEIASERGSRHELAAVERFVEGLRLFTLAESLGGVESLVAHPATMTHAAMEPEARRAAGIGDALLRLSVGIEDPKDLVADLRHALDRVLEEQSRCTSVATAAAC